MRKKNIWNWRINVLDIRRSKHHGSIEEKRVWLHFQNDVVGIFYWFIVLALQVFLNSVLNYLLNCSSQNHTRGAVSHISTRLDYCSTNTHWKLALLVKINTVRRQALKSFYLYSLPNRSHFSPWHNIFKQNCKTYHPNEKNIPTQYRNKP